MTEGREKYEPQAPAEPPPAPEDRLTSYSEVPPPPENLKITKGD